MSIGRDTFRLTTLPALRAATANRTQLRRQVAALVTAGQEWLARFDAQQNAAPADFAASRPGQFSTYLDSLPDVQVDAVDPADQVP